MDGSPKNQKGVERGLEALRDLGAIDANGCVDLDGPLDSVRPQIGEYGTEIELPVIGGLTIYPADLDTLARYIKDS